MVSRWYKASLFGSIFIGVLLIVLGGYFGLLAFYQKDITEDLYQLKLGKFISTEDLQTLADNQITASSLSNNGILLQDLGLTEITLAKRYGYFSETGKNLLLSAKDHLQKGLAKAPSHSLGWMRLAYTELLLNAPSKNASDAIYMSIVTMPYDYKTLYYRLNLAMMSWSYFSEDEKDILMQQIRIGWKWDKKKLLDIITSDNVKNIVTTALQNSPEELMEFLDIVGN